jgi:hypothetical protein
MRIALKDEENIHEWEVNIDGPEGSIYEVRWVTPMIPCTTQHHVSTTESFANDSDLIKHPISLIHGPVMHRLCGGKGKRG